MPSAPTPSFGFPTATAIGFACRWLDIYVGVIGNPYPEGAPVHNALCDFLSRAG